MAQQLRKPVAMVCTSGSALLNYYPAIAEAFYSEIPLVVLSADRPPHKIDIADGQTIRQRNVFSNHIVAQMELEIVEHIQSKEAIESNESQLNAVLNKAIIENGPVHINVPFEEPLYELVQNAQITVNSVSIPATTYPTDIQLFKKDWQQSTKKLVILSTLYEEVLTTQDIDSLLVDPSVLVMSEVSANVIHKDIIWSIDTLIAPIESNPALLEQLFPDVVLTIGGMIVSKKVKQLLRKANGLKHYHLGENKPYDTFFALKQHIKSHPAVFFKSLNFDTVKSDYQSFWVQHFKHLIERRISYLKNIPWSDFKAFELVFNHLPDDLLLQLGNSSTIRYAQLFPMKGAHSIFSNRGTSGIDGCTSTAIGSAMKSSQPCILITGDISFFYDSNALWNNYIPQNFKIILINNSGGGIFRILPGHKDSVEFDTYFETKHGLNASHLSAMFGFDYHSVESETAFAKTYSEFISSNDRPQLLEVFTPSNVNESILLDYFKYLR
jgi:2-succinyl-5-enolpyruvyl-6-hydroxy-3-cyclohexene-1-carboxylate synthase